MRVNAGSASLTHESIIIYLDVDRDGFIFLIGRDALPLRPGLTRTFSSVQMECIFRFVIFLNTGCQSGENQNQPISAYTAELKNKNKKTLTLFWELALSDVIDRRSGRSTVQIYFFRHDFIELNNFIPTVLYKYFF